MLNFDGEEEESDSSSDDIKKEIPNKLKDTKEKKEKTEPKINNNIKEISKKKSKNDFDDFFKNDSNNYDIMGFNNTNSKNIDNVQNSLKDNNEINNNINNKKNENSEDENSDEDLNLTPVDDKDDFSIKENEEEKEDMKNKNKNENDNNINDLNNNILNNKDNNNNKNSSSISNSSKNNNSEKSEEKKEKINQNSSIEINNKINKDNNKSLSNNSESSKDENSNNNNMNNKSKNKIKEKEDNKINENLNSDISISIKTEKSKKKESNSDQNSRSSNSNSSSSEKSSISSKEEEKKEDNIKESNLNKNPEIKNSKKENNNNFNIINNINNNKIGKENNLNDNNIKLNEGNNFHNNKSLIKQIKTLDDKFTQKSSLKFSKNEISEIKKNDSSIDKEQNSRMNSLSFSSYSNSEKNQKNKKDDNKNKNSSDSSESEKSESSEKSEEQSTSKKEEINNKKIIKKDSNNEKEKIKVKEFDKKKSESINDNIYIKDEFYIKYIRLKRKGFKEIVENNYISGFNIFNECYELSSKYLKDKVKKIDSLINMSFCQYYNGNFNNSLLLLEKAKKIFDTVSLGECHISPRDKIRLGIKLYSNSSMANLSLNKYNESISDIKSIINLIDPENNLEKKKSLIKYALYLLFTVDSLLNIGNEDEIMTNINDYFKYNTSDKKLIDVNNIKKLEINDVIKLNQNEKMIKDFLACLKYKNYSIILNSFIENATLENNNKNLTGYYFCIFNQYLITYNTTINTNKDNQKKFNKEYNLKELKERLDICYKNLFGEEITNNIKDKNKNINNILIEFDGKMKCIYEIFSILENYEKTLNMNTQEYYNEKNLTQKEKAKLKAKLKNKEESPILVKLCIKYSYNYLLKKKNALIEEINNKKNNADDENQESLNNINLLIKELEILLYKIKTYEIDISSIKRSKLNADILKNINIILQNFFGIVGKSLIYGVFHKLRKKIIKINSPNNDVEIEKFLDSNYDIIIKGMTLMKINFGSKGYKVHYYSINNDSSSLNVKDTGNEPHPSLSYSYSLIKDVTKITYGLRSLNLIKILKDEEYDPDTRKLLKYPWKFISFILKKKSVDLYCENNQVNNWFYGLKYFTNEKKVEYKIISTNKFVINKIKYRIAIKLKVAIDNNEIKDKKSISIIEQLIKEKAFHNISFAKLMLLYNKLMKV